MRKLFLLVVAAFISSAAFGQATQFPGAEYLRITTELTKKFTVEFHAISGRVLTHDSFSTVDGDKTTYTDGRKLWSGNEYEIDLGYSQNWSKVPWLTTTFTTVVIVNPAIVYEGSANAPGYRSGEPPAKVRGELGLNLTKYLSFYTDSRLLVGATTQWGWGKGSHGTLIQFGIEIFAGNKSISGADYKAYRDKGNRDNVPNIANGPILDAVWLDFTWAVKMPLGFANSLLFRPIAFSGDNSSQILEGMYIRIQETLSWTRDGFSVYARVRYNIKNIAYPVYSKGLTGGTWTKGIDHDLSIRAGLTYTYNLSPL